MKKILALIISILMIFSLAACGAEDIREAAETAGQIAEILTDDSFAQDSEQTAADDDIDLPVQSDDEEQSDTDESSQDSKIADSNEASENSKAADTDSKLTVPDEDGWYYDLDNVVLYLMAYGKLPANYITKSEAQDLGWSGGSVQKYKAGAAIGGSHYGNYEGLLPDGNYTECDLDTDGASSRGAKRLVFSDEGRYFYTEDHYESFAEVTEENGELVLNYDYR